MPKGQMAGRGSVGKQAIPREIWVLVAAAFVIALGFGLIAPILPQFAASFDVSVLQVSAVISIFAMSRLVTAPLAGWLNDAFGPRPVYLTGLVIVGVTTGFISVATHYWHLLALRTVAGLGSSMFTVSAMGLIVRLAPPQSRGRASSTYASAFLIGNIIGPVVGAALSVLGMRWPFVIYGASVLLAALIVFTAMPAQIGKLQRTSAPLPTMRFGEAVRSSAYRAGLASAFASGWTNIGVRVATLPLFAAAIFHNGGAIAGLAMAAFAAGNAACLQFSGRLSDVHGRRPLMLSGLFVNGVFTIALGWVDTVPVLLLTSALAGAGAGLFNPAQQAMVADVIGNERSAGRVLANFQMFADLGAILGPLVVGALVESWGFTWGFALCGAIVLAAIVPWWLAQETLQRRGPAN